MINSDVTPIAPAPTEVVVTKTPISTPVTTVCATTSCGLLLAKRALKNATI